MNSIHIPFLFDSYSLHVISTSYYIRLKSLNFLHVVKFARFMFTLCHRDGVDLISDAETFLRPQVLSSTCWCSRSAATCRSSSTWTYRRTLALSPVYMASGQSRYFSVKTGIFETIMRNLTCVITLLICCNIYFTRFLSICWVVLGHQYAYSIYLASNPTELPEVRPLLSSRCTFFTFFFWRGGL